MTAKNVEAVAMLIRQRRREITDITGFSFTFVRSFHKVANN
jgi:hypothetical protein